MQTSFFKRTLSATFLLVLTSLTFSPHAEAQILKKIAKGVEKVNKALDKVDKATKPNNKQVTPTNSGKAKEASSAKQTSAISESGWKSRESQTNVPYLDSNTRFLRIPSLFVSPEVVSDVNENIFAVNNQGKYAFWHVDGRKLFDADWEYCGGSVTFPRLEMPEFNSGVVAVLNSKPNAAGKKVICLLYADGRVKELDPSYKEVTVFADGLALVTQEVNYNKRYFYINVRGEKLYPALDVSADCRDAMRPLKCGLRGFYGKSGLNRKWGFIDKNGNVVIEPKFKDIRDFSEGYAWVTISPDDDKYGLSGKAVLIDNKGNVVFTPKNDIINSFNDVADVCNGIFYCQGEYYDTTGKKLAEYTGGTGFYGGYAYVYNNDDYVPCEVVNTSFDVVRTYTSTKVKNTECPSYLVKEGQLNFRPFGLSSGYHDGGGKVFTPDGRIILSDWNPNGTYNCINSFKQFSASGYARAQAQFGDRRYRALIEPDGHVAWLFAENDQDADISDTPPLPPGPILWEPTDSIPIGITDPEMPPVGPCVVSQTTYKITVKAEPAEGGSVSLSPSGTYKYGDYVTLNATPANKEWAVLNVTTSDKYFTVPKPGEPFPVVTDMELTVHFVKAEDEEAPESSGAFQGSLTLKGKDGFLNMTIPVYAQISAEKADSNLYDANTYGFLVPMFNPKERIVVPGLATYIFAAPLRICGVQKDDAGKQWLVLDGGSWICGNLKVNPESSPVGGFVLNSMLAFDGFSTTGSIPRHYRIEMKDIDSSTGAFTLGTLETYSPNGVWVPGADKSLTKTTKGTFGTKHDYGYNHDFFEGVRLEPAKKRSDVYWTPPMEWYDNKQSVFDSVVRSFGVNYRNAHSNYYELFPSKK